MNSAIGILWTLLSVMVAGTCCFSFFQPFWFVHSDYLHAFGMYNHCIRDLRYRNPVQTCQSYGGEFHLGNLPSGAWQAACVLFGGGCIFLCFGAILSLITLCLPESLCRRVTLFSGYVQTVGVMLLCSGLFIYPVGLGSRVVRHYCGDSAIYRSGHCEMGWSYMLAIMGSALSIFCPFLSQYTHLKVVDTVRGVYV